MTAKSRISSLRNRLYPYRSILFVLFIIVIFHNSWTELLDKYIIPIVSQIPNNNLIIASFLFLFSSLICCLNFKQLYKANYLISPTLLVEISVIGIYAYLRYDSHYDFYGYKSIDYAFIFLVPFLLAEVLRWIKIWKEKCQKRIVHEDFPNSSFLKDTPCVDESKEREAYAEFLIQHILGTFKSSRKDGSQSNPFIKNGSFVINVGEEYGYGKTSFFALMHKKLTEKWPNCYISFNYQPWLCENEKAMVTELFNRYSEELSPYAPQINKNITNYIRSLLDNSDNVIVHFFRTMLCQSSSMHEEREKLKGTIAKLEKPIIVFIDDVDRLQKEELLTLLNLVRDTADFQNVFYIMAADKEHLIKCLEDCNINNPGKYVKKIINYDFLLPANDGIVMATLQKELMSILDKYIKEEGELNRIVSSIINHENIESVFNNIRDIKRILNDYMVTLAVIKSGPKEDIDYKDLFLLTIIKSLRPDVYKSLRDYDEQLLDLLNNEIYILKTKYDDVHNEKLLDFIKTAAANTDNNDTVKEKKCSTVNEMMVDSRMSSDEFVAHSLRYLFGSQRRFGNEFNIQSKESYYRYFSGQFRKNQMSSLEVETILKSNEEDYLRSIREVISTNKTNSFITRMNYWSKKWTKSQFEFIKRIFLFIEEYRQSLRTTQSFIRINLISQREIIYKDIQYSQILYNLYKATPNHVIDAGEKELLHNFLKEDGHYDFSATTLNALHGWLPYDLSIKYEEIDFWRNELICQFISKYFNDTPNSIKDEILDVIPLLKGKIAEGPWDNEFANYLSNTPNFMSWFERMVNYKNGVFTWDDKYMEQLDFTFRGNFEYLIRCCQLHIQQDERIKDLMKLIRCPYLEHENYEDHPFLLYIKNKCESEK